MVLAQISLGRAGQPREIGAVAAFFASDEASYRHRAVDSRRRRLGRKVDAMRADWTPEAEARRRASSIRAWCRARRPRCTRRSRSSAASCTATDLTNDISHRQPDLQGPPAHGDVAAPEPRRRAEVRADEGAVFLRGGGVHGVRAHLDALRLDQPHRPRARRPADRQDAARVAHGARRVARLRAQAAELATSRKAEIEAQLAEQRLTLKPGSVFLYHTGWYRKFETAPFDYIRDYPGPRRRGGALAGGSGRHLRRRRRAERRLVPRGRGAHDAAGPHDVPRARRAEHREPAQHRPASRARAFTFVGLPLKIRNGCGSPIRAVALTED